MIETVYFGTINFQWWEYILLPGYFLIIYIFAARIKSKNLTQHPEYRYFILGLNFKIFAAIFFGIIYVFYYKGGDTISYYQSTIPLKNLLLKDPSDFYRIYFHTIHTNLELYNTFNFETGIPLNYMYIDPKTFMVCKLTFPIMMITFQSYFGTTLILATLSYIPLWKLYRTILSYFPTLQFELAIGILFIPSVLFWGGGIMKDTYTFGAISFAVVFFSRILNNPKYVMNYIYLIISVLMMLSIKPYMLIVLFPSFSIWIIAQYISAVKNILFKVILLPLILTISFAVAFLILNMLGDSMDKFALDNALETAVITQQDLIREDQYGSNNFDIGEFDATLTGVLSKFPIATLSGLFRPSLVEVRSPVMLLSALENLFMISLMIITLFKVKLRMIFQLIYSHPFLIFSVTFVILFAFMIGLTTSNFGALVRFKIPLMPFFMSTILILFSTKKIVFDSN